MYVHSSFFPRLFFTLPSQIRTHLQQMLSRKNKSLKDIVKTLKVYYDNVDGEDAQNDQISQKEILHNLIAFLDAC